MAISWLNRSRLEVGDLPMIHGLLCQDRDEDFVVEAPPNSLWKARLELEWGVPVVVISNKKQNWRGKDIWEESRITLDALENKIHALSEIVWKDAASEYVRSLGLDVRKRLKQFQGHVTILLATASWGSRLLNRIRSYFFSDRSDHYMRDMKSNFRTYTVQNFHSRFVEDRSEFTPSRGFYTHRKSDSFFDSRDVCPTNSESFVHAKTESIYAKARRPEPLKRSRALRNYALSDQLSR